MSEEIEYNYKEEMNIIFDEDLIKDWYSKYRPGGSGPSVLMKSLCAALEEIADLKGISLNGKNTNKNLTKELVKKGPRKIGKIITQSKKIKQRSLISPVLKKINEDLDDGN